LYKLSIGFSKYFLDFNCPNLKAIGSINESELMRVSTSIIFPPTMSSFSEKNDNKNGRTTSKAYQIKKLALIDALVLYLFWKIHQFGQVFHLSRLEILNLMIGFNSLTSNC
jgi:hypothetical protein